MPRFCPGSTSLHCGAIGGSHPDDFHVTPTRANGPTSFWSLEKCITPENRFPPRHPFGSPSPSVGCSRVLPFSALLAQGRRAAPCTRSPSRFLPTKPTTRKRGSVA